MMSNEKTRSLQGVDEELFRLLIASVKDYAIFMTDTHGQVLSWNGGATAINGYNENEVLDKHINMFYTARDAEAGLPQYNLNEALKHGTFSSQGWRLRKDGSRFWADVTFNAMHSEQGEHIGFAIVVRDITGRKQVEDEKEASHNELQKRVTSQGRQLLANELLFRKLIENSYDGITLLDEHFHVFYRSRSAERISGWNDEDRMQAQMLDIIHPDDRETLAELLPQILDRPGEPVLVNFRSRHRRGHYIWLECQFNNMLHDENIHAIVCNFRDITQRVEDEHEISAQSKQITDILERITDGFIMLDKDFRYTFANKQVGEMLGASSKSLIGRNVWEVFPQAIGSDTYLAMKAAFSTQKYIHNEDYFEPLHLWQENHIYPSPDGLSMFIRDISERKLAEKQVYTQNAQLKEAAEIQTAILNALPPHIALLNEQGMIVTVNESWKKFTNAVDLGLPNHGIGASYLEVCGQVTGADSLHSSHIAKGISLLMHGPRREFVYEYTSNFTKKPRWFQLVAAPIRDHSHKGVVVLHTDITASKQQEAEIKNQNTILKEVAWIGSHEVRRPVASIMGLVYLIRLATGIEEKEELIELVGKCADELDQIVHLIHDKVKDEVHPK